MYPKEHPNEKGYPRSPGEKESKQGVGNPTSTLPRGGGVEYLADGDYFFTERTHKAPLAVAAEICCQAAGGTLCG